MHRRLKISSEMTLEIKIIHIFKRALQQGQGDVKITKWRRRTCTYETAGRYAVSIGLAHYALHFPSKMHRLRLEEPAGPHPASISYTTTSIAGLYRSISILQIKRAASSRAHCLPPSPSNNRHQSARKRPQFLCPASSTWLNKSTRRCHACITS